MDGIIAINFHCYRSWTAKLDAPSRCEATFGSKG